MPDLTGAEPDAPGGDEGARGTPRWVKVFGVVALVLVVLVVMLLLVGGGRHGPGRHTGGDAPPADIAARHWLAPGGNG